MSNIADVRQATFLKATFAYDVAMMDQKMPEVQ
jgi:hypothetical protein